jgi:hypothetical protein
MSFGNNISSKDEHIPILEKVRMADPAGTVEKWNISSLSW